MNTTRQIGFSWNLGALAGTAAGCSAWMMVTPFVANWHVAGIIIALICAITIWVSVPILWQLRATVEALRGMLILLGVAFIATGIFLLYAHIMGLPLVVSWPPTELAAPKHYFWTLLLFPVLGAIFMIIAQMNKSNSEQDGATKP